MPANHFRGCPEALPLQQSLLLMEVVIDLNTVATPAVPDVGRCFDSVLP
ncbi:hypothetical protein [Nitrolancea hollandica]|nr:hypothetical protein [Nitrolancea hollandica]